MTFHGTMTGGVRMTGCVGVILVIRGSERGAFGDIDACARAKLMIYEIHTDIDHLCLRHEPYRLWSLIQ